MEKQGNVLVVDFNNIWNKYLYVRKGDFTNTIISVLHLFRSIYKSKFFSKVFIVMDGKPDEKYNEYKQYKQNRKKNPDKYIPLKVVTSVLSQYFTVVGGKRLEGDEVIAYIALKANRKYNTYIFSNDKDFIQLMQYGINIVSSFKQGKINELLTSEQALLKFKNNKGLPLKDLKYVLPYRVFKGDSSDGIPSACTGMRDDCIREIIYNHWGECDVLTETSFTEMLNSISDIKLIDKLSEHKEHIFRNFKLMNLCTISDNIKSQIHKIYYKFDYEGLKQYTTQEDLYKWV